MNNNDKLFIEALVEFKRSGYFNGGNFTVPNDKTKVYELAIRLAYKDLQWRTISKHNNDLKESNISRIASLFKANVESGGTHIKLIEETAKVFMDDFGEIASEQCFGKAQKVINMGLKYLYCLNSPLIKIDYENRDMPLDDRIFDFYYDYRKHLGIRDKNKILSWSNISKEDYLVIQANIRKYMDKLGLDMYPIEAEFIIWNYATAKLVVSAYEKAKKDYEKLLNELSTTRDCFEYISDELGK